MASRETAAEVVCPCCSLPFIPREYDGAAVQTMCIHCHPHKPIRGEEPQRVMDRLTDHAERATRILLGARAEVYRLRAGIESLREARRDRAEVNSGIFERLQDVAALHGQVGDTRRCACGLAIDNCETLPLVARYKRKT